VVMCWEETGRNNTRLNTLIFCLVCTDRTVQDYKYAVCVGVVGVLRESVLIHAKHPRKQVIICQQFISISLLI
jgi:hypothetical protein